MAKASLAPLGKALSFETYRYIADVDVASDGTWSVTFTPFAYRKVSAKSAGPAPAHVAPKAKAVAKKPKKLPKPKPDIWRAL